MHIAHLVNGGHVMTFVFRIGTLVVRGSHVPTDRVLVEVGRSPTSINTTWRGNSKASFCDRAVVRLQFLWLVHSEGDINRKFMNSHLFDFFLCQSRDISTIAQLNKFHLKSVCVLRKVKCWLLIHNMANPRRPYKVKLSICF